MGRMKPAPFNVMHALDEWRQVYPDRAERIQALKRELRRCQRKSYYTDRGTHKRSIEYPITEKAIKRMLEVLEGGATS